MPRPKHSVDLDYDEVSTANHTLVEDRGVYFSADGLRMEEELTHARQKKHRVAPSSLNDSLASWVPAPDDDFSEEAAYTATTSSAADSPKEPTVLGKRKQYTSTVNPMSLFRPLMGFFVDELNRHAGLGDDWESPCCAICDTAYDRSARDSGRIFKCYECGQFLQCTSCCLSTHQRSPLHEIQEWNGSFWIHATLRDLGLIYQIGHGGFPCPFPDDRVRSLTVIEAPIIHEIRFRYCKCTKSDEADNLQQLLRNAWFPATVTDPGTCATFRTLEAYRMYNVIGNLNVRDFITTLERVTDTSALSGMTWLPDRYRQFQRMARQWSFLKRVRRAGRGHDPQGVPGTKLGACAVSCWACPHDGRNLPEDWRSVDPSYQFLYMLILAVDANFRLKNRMRATEIDDPSLGPGWGYFVEPRRYQHHLRKYVGEKDISTCIAFAALLQKDTRLTTGLRVSGVGGVVCARHECMRPNGLGDLQKGERYANMDWIVMSAVAGIGLLLLTISYDIACQWKINYKTRQEKLPEDIRLPADLKVQCALPVWHAGSHNESCQNDNSLSFKVGVGKTDGEGVERTWGSLNPVAYHTKDAGLGQRADTLEGVIDNHNFLKNIGQCDALQRKLVVAIAERDTQVRNFKEVSRTVKAEVKEDWKRMINEWIVDSAKMNPYTLKLKDCPTEAEVRLEVRKDEEKLNSDGAMLLHGRSATAFLAAGIQIEDGQRRIRTELKGTVLIATDRENKIEEWRHALLVKIGKFRTLQAIYMPGAAQVMENAEAARDPDAPPPRPEKMKLWVPSDMPSAGENDVLRGCIPGLIDMEVKLRVAQCNNSLTSLRSRLHAKRWLIGFRNENVSGQVQATKARTLIGQVGERAESYAQRYRRGRAALVQLKGEAAFPHLRELKPEHVVLDGDHNESDAASRKKLGMLGAGRGARVSRNAEHVVQVGDGTNANTRRRNRNAPGTSKRVMSWIWTAPGALENEEARLHDSIRVEWARAHARKNRWSEEVMLLREEMRLVLRYLAWQAAWWRECAEVERVDWDAAVREGAHAYALKQADWHERLAAHFRLKWNTPALTTAQELVAADGWIELFE
ncbi:hypothetical protein C8R45DRAFT_1206552 [Mycena sanguinolenta]|nr:hypothetical protein C8R45DRAFT_1206552 [Mycena sanguinolenta]